MIRITDVTSPRMFNALLFGDERLFSVASDPEKKNQEFWVNIRTYNISIRMLFFIIFVFLLSIVTTYVMEYFQRDETKENTNRTTRLDHSLRHSTLSLYIELDADLSVITTRYLCIAK